MDVLMTGFPTGVPWSVDRPMLIEGIEKTLAFTAISFVGAALLGPRPWLCCGSRGCACSGGPPRYTEVFKNVPLLAIIFIPTSG